MSGAVALGVDVADRLLADVVPGEAADDLLRPRAGVGEHENERAIAEVEFRADLLDLDRRKMWGSRARSSRGLATPAAALYSTSSSLTAKDRIDCTIVIALTTVAVPTLAFSSSARKRVTRFGVSSRTPYSPRRGRM
jgi:hypothetical protein